MDGHGTSPLFCYFTLICAGRKLSFYYHYPRGKLSAHCKFAPMGPNLVINNRYRAQVVMDSGNTLIWPKWLGTVIKSPQMGSCPL